jgi:type III pantothenate kinase
MEDIFTINIGNTNTQFGVFSGGSVNDLKSCPSTELSADILPDGMPIAMASVASEPEKVFSKSNKNIFRLSIDAATGLDFSRVDASTLGADRLANAIMLAHSGAKLPAVCIDCGTAITFEIVDCKRRFLGGAIAPGRKLQRSALCDYTSKLPFIPINNSIDGLNGDNTANAIRLGVDVGSLGMVRELVARAESLFPEEDISFFSTGGDAEFFSNNIGQIEFAGFDYTLKGIAKAWELNKN